MTSVLDCRIGHHDGACNRRHPALSGWGASVNPRAAGGCPRRAALAKLATERRRIDAERGREGLASEVKRTMAPTWPPRTIAATKGKAGAFDRIQAECVPMWKAAPKRAYNTKTGVRYDPLHPGRVVGRLYPRSKTFSKTVIVLT